MDQTLSERKRLILQRIAGSREAVKRDLNATIETARGLYARVRDSRTYIRTGLALGGGLMSVFLGKRLMHALIGRHGTTTCPVPHAGSGAGQALWWLLAQLLSSLLLPWLREQLRAPALSDSLKRMHPSRVFFRWLGLEK